MKKTKCSKTIAALTAFTLTAPLMVSSVPARATTYAGEHFPETRTEMMSRDDVAEMTHAQRRYAINEIYARHGFLFADMAIRKQFLQFSWYRPVPGRTMKGIEAHLGRIESHNLRVLADVRDDARDSSSSDASYPGEHFPETRTNILSQQDMNNMGVAKVRYAINEMYARHGFLFGDMAIRRQFLRFRWYHPVPGRTMHQAEARFNDFERSNLIALTQWRDGD